MATMTRILLIIVFGLLLAAAKVSAQPLKNPDPLETVENLDRDQKLALFEAQTKREENDDYAGAAERIVEFIRKNPDKDHYLLRFSAGADFSRAHLDEKALEQYQWCVKLEPRFAQGWLNLGEMAYRLQKYELAGDALLNGYQRHEDRPPNILYFSAAAYVMASKADRALPIFERLVSGQHGPPEMEWFRGLISCCLELEKREDGTKAVRGLIDWHGDDPEAWELAYQYHASAGEYREAAIALTIAGYMRPLSRGEQVQLGDLYNVVGVPEAATKYYTAAFDSTATPAEVERLASAYLAAYDMDEARATLEDALKSNPTSRLWSLLGDLHYMEQRYRDAHDCYREASVLDPGQSRPYVMMAYCSLELKDHSDALVQLAEAAHFPEAKERADDLAKRIRESQAP